MAFGLVPEILDPIDMVFLLGEEPGVIDAKMPGAGHVEYVVRAEGVRVDDGIRTLTPAPQGFARFEVGNSFLLPITEDAMLAESKTLW